MTYPSEDLPQSDEAHQAVSGASDEAGQPPGDAANPCTAYPADEPAWAQPVAAGLAPPDASRRRLPQPHLGWAILFTIGLFVFQIVASFVIALAIIVVVLAAGQSINTLQGPEFLARFSVWMVPVATFSNLAFALLVAGIAFRTRFFELLGIRNMAAHQWLLVLLLVAPLAIVASETGNCASEVLPSFNLEIPAEFAVGPWIVVFLAGCLLPGVGEEIFFRGHLSRGLIAHHGLVWGTLLASLLFALVHLNPPQVVGTFVLGVGMQLVFLTTRSLLAPIVLHTLNNTGAFFVMRVQSEFPVPGLNVLSEDGIVHTPLPLLLAALAAAGLLAYLLYRTRTRWVLEGGQEWSPGYLTAEVPAAGLGARPDYAAPNYLAVALAIISLALTAHFLYQAHAEFAG